MQIYLGVIPANQNDWLAMTRQWRALYDELRNLVGCCCRDNLLLQLHCIVTVDDVESRHSIFVWLQFITNPRATVGGSSDDDISKNNPLSLETEVFTFVWYIGLLLFVRTQSRDMPKFKLLWCRVLGINILKTKSCVWPYFRTLFARKWLFYRHLRFNSITASF